nr:hypothetical protein Iba_chr07aCG3150 [Ipomoea batatas]GMD20276.1 hypothetical protein Iba_chr07fCG3320 [Ipomoea batatas]
MDLTAAAMSQWAERISERSEAVKDFEACFTKLIAASKSSGAGDIVTVIGEFIFIFSSYHPPPPRTAPPLPSKSPPRLSTSLFPLRRLRYSSKTSPSTPPAAAAPTPPPCPPRSSSPDPKGSAPPGG